MGVNFAAAVRSSRNLFHEAWLAPVGRARRAPSSEIPVNWSGFPECPASAAWRIFTSSRAVTQWKHRERSRSDNLRERPVKFPHLFAPQHPGIFRPCAIDVKSDEEPVWARLDSDAAIEPEAQSIARRRFRGGEFACLRSAEAGRISCDHDPARAAPAPRANHSRHRSAGRVRRGRGAAPAAGIHRSRLRESSRGCFRIRMAGDQSSRAAGNSRSTPFRAESPHAE